MEVVVAEIMAMDSGKVRAGVVIKAVVLDGVGVLQVMDQAQVNVFVNALIKKFLKLCCIF